MTNLKQKRVAKGFTLAEVLITLGIIGVVAAMTIPNLISNYQKRAWTAQLKKSYATLNQGFRRMLADDNASLLSQTETFNSIGGTLQNGTKGAKYKLCEYRNDIDGAECKDFYTNLGKYFKISSINRLSNYNLTFLNNRTVDVYYGYSTGTAITFLDGTMIFKFGFYSQDRDNKTNIMMKGVVGSFFLDVNGLKRPNKFGRDIFLFYLGDNGIVYPYGSQASSEYGSGSGSTGLHYWKNDLDQCDISSDGYGCAARVLETGKMDY